MPPTSGGMECWTPRTHTDVPNAPPQGGRSETAQELSSRTNQESRRRRLKSIRKGVARRVPTVFYRGPVLRSAVNEWTASPSRGTEGSGTERHDRPGPNPRTRPTAPAVVHHWHDRPRVPHRLPQRCDRQTPGTEQEG